MSSGLPNVWNFIDEFIVYPHKVLTVATILLALSSKKQLVNLIEPMTKT
jgi:hypothetical protein